jgi:hypothetical protein
MSIVIEKAAEFCFEIHRHEIYTIDAPDRRQRGYFVADYSIGHLFVL